MLKGLSAFPITPADAAGRVDVAGLTILINRLCAGAVDSIGLLGSTGTYAYLSRGERRRAVGAALAQARATPVLVGVGALRTDEAVGLAEDARAAGAAAGLLAPVSYTPLTDDEVFSHVVAVAATGLPIVVYDNPATTHFRFSPALLARLAQVEGIVAAKNPASSAQAAVAHLAELRAVVPAGFSIGYSGDWSVLDALLAGADAWYCVVAGLFPAPARAIVDAVAAGDAAEARALHARLEPLWSLFREFSSVRTMHACADILGICRGDLPRPLMPLEGRARQRVAVALTELALS